MAVAEGSVEGYAQLVDKRRRADRRPRTRARPPSAATGSTTTSSTRSTSSRAAPPEADDEVVIDRGSADDGRLRGRRHAPPCSPRPARTPSTVVGIATLRRRRQPRRRHASRCSPPTRPRRCSPSRARSTPSRCVAEDGVAAGRAASTASPRRCPTASRSLTGAEITEENQDDHRRGPRRSSTPSCWSSPSSPCSSASFIIYNTFSILVAQRTREMALLRAIGASRRQVLGSVLLEAVVVGLVARSLGLVAGVGVAVGPQGAARRHRHRPPRRRHRRLADARSSSPSSSASCVTVAVGRAARPAGPPRSRRSPPCATWPSTGPAARRRRVVVGVGRHRPRRGRSARRPVRRRRRRSPLVGLGALAGLRRRRRARPGPRPARSSRVLGCAAAPAAGHDRARSPGRTPCATRSGRRPRPRR